MENLKAKLKKQGGFTMVELLIVVAIIAILVAVSIPMFNNVMEKARHGVDQANYRDAQSLAYAEFLADPNPKKTFENAVPYSYKVTDDTHMGELVPGADDGVKPQCTCVAAVKDLKLTLTIQNKDGKPEIKFTGWVFKDGKPAAAS